MKAPKSQLEPKNKEKVISEEQEEEENVEELPVDSDADDEVFTLNRCVFQFFFCLLDWYFWDLYNGSIIFQMGTIYLGSDFEC